MTTRHVTLRDTKDSDGSRLLWASLSSEGDITIEGRDYGDGVERFFGVREYEWVWTIRAKHVPALCRALGAGSDVLATLGERFSGDDAAGLGTFLEANDITIEKWSRHGD